MAKLARHGVDMAAVAEFDFETAETWTDTREIYGCELPINFASRANTLRGQTHIALGFCIRT
jgi:hypothetical protein